MRHLDTDIDAKNRTLRAKETAEFIRKHPEGVTAADFKKAGITPWGIGRLLDLNLIKRVRTRDPKGGARANRTMWKPTHSIPTGGADNATAQT